MSRESVRSGLRPDQKPPELSRLWGIIVVVSGEVYLSLHAKLCEHLPQGILAHPTTRVFSPHQSVPCFSAESASRNASKGVPAE
jgi:formylmethanofuran:tetrahydromethanopterin formyltransferase